MSGLVFKLEKTITGVSAATGTNFPKPYHAFKATITEVVVENGWIKVKLEGVDYKAGQYDAISQKADSQYVIDFVTKLANAVVASNESLKGAIGQGQVDLSKWAGKGYQVGVVYKPQQKKNDATGVWEDTKFCEPHYAINIADVDTWKVDQAKYDAWHAKYWGNGSTATQSAPATNIPLPTNDDDFPF